MYSTHDTMRARKNETTFHHNLQLISHFTFHSQHLGKCSEEDLKNCLAALLAGEEVNLEGNVMNGGEFSDKVLGFAEEDEEIGEFEEEGGDPAAAESGGGLFGDY